MPFQIIVPQIAGGDLNLTVNEGRLLFVLGANGVGKSTLMHRIFTQHRDAAKWVKAHRQSWFESNAITITPDQRRAISNNIRGEDSNPQARWTDAYVGQRPSMALFDLIETQNTRARTIADAVDGGNLELARDLSKRDAPIRVINELLRLCDLPIAISVERNEEVVASKSGSAPYSISELSDGERNALLVVATVLTAPARTLLLIDEPERHLHRSIISPLITLLCEKRADCAFVISTHEAWLPMDNPTASTLLVRRCELQARVGRWEADLLPEGADIDDGIRQDILGARRQVIFVEGTAASLDKPLYSLLFPNVSVIAKSGCRDVERAVRGIGGSPELHWLRTFGIVDNDGRTADEVARLEALGVFAMSVYSVESVYYHPEIQRRVTERLVATTGGDTAATRLANAERATIEAARTHLGRLSEKAGERRLRDEAMRQLPGSTDMAAGAVINIRLDVPTALAEERARLQTAVDNGNALEVIASRPLRETGALARIATLLGFQSRTQYENAVRKLLSDDADARAFARTLFGGLAAAVAPQPPLSSLATR